LDFESFFWQGQFDVKKYFKNIILVNNNKYTKKNSMAKSIIFFIPTKRYFFRRLLFSPTTGLVWLKY